MKPEPRLLLVVLTTLLVGVLAFWLASCKKDTSPSGTGGGGGGGGGGTATVNGVVTRADTAGNPPITGASVQAGTGTPVTTDANGNFSVAVTGGTNVTLNVTKSGYSLNEVVVNVAGGATKSISVSLLKEGAKKTVAVTARDSVADGSYKLNIPANFVNATGNVTVSVTGLDPTTNEVRALPGGLEAVDAQGNTKYLQPVSFAEYVVRDANGNVVQVNQSSGQGANIELPIPASLRGQTGYRNGDPIECYLYDAASGKWKTPVPGIVGPSSIDGQPAIKATIFHLSWYGGAPALNARACVRGYVRNTDGTAAAGVSVEGFAGGSSTTNAQGFYQIDAAPGSDVRVVATVFQGTTVRTGEVHVRTGGVQDTCSLAPDITLGASQSGSFSVNAYLFRLLSSGFTFDDASVTIKLVTPTGTQTNWDSALVKIGYGSQMTTIPSTGNGNYVLGTPSLSLAGGQVYSITIDFDKNGTIDANGQVRMAGSTVITFPTPNASVGRTFTATWFDSAASISGYSSNYWLSISGQASRFFLTTQRSKIVGNGVVDSSFYGYPQPNDPLPAGSYSMNVYGVNGPAGFLTISLPQPNINGQNVEGFFYSYMFGDAVAFTSTGTGASARPSAVRSMKMPLALKEMYHTLPKEIRRKLKLNL